VSSGDGARCCHDVLGVPGVAESALSRELAERLPRQVPAAPWRCHADAVLWACRGGRAARAALPPVLRGRTRASGVVGGMVRYHDTPVGAYDEVLGAVAFRRGLAVRASVAFMAVDSMISLTGGRRNWSLPKVAAEFAGDPASGMRATAASWSVSAVPRSFGPTFPVAVSATVEQQWPDGRVRPAALRARGRVRLARVTVSVSGSGDLDGWLRPGDHLGLLVRDVTFTLGQAPC
jgi:hypothetical protein